MLGHTSVLKDHLSVIVSEENSQCETSTKENEDKVPQTLKQGKEFSNSRTKGRKEKKEIAAKKKSDKKNSEAGACCSGNGACSIF